MEAFLQLLSLLIFSYHCQARPGRAGDQPKAAEASVKAFPAGGLLSASPDVVELTPASPPAAVTLEDGRYVWGAFDVEAEAPAANVDDFPVSAVSASTDASPRAAVTLEDGRWVWGALARDRPV